ncbi:hypothetical protein G9A89_015188 [Geosiphon pyriformis]|nr:hypothetical protein G9A89_015188 [Geosiphon pyriformis]
MKEDMEEISTDGSLVKAGSVEARGAAAFVTHGMEASYSITVDGTLSSTKTEAKTVLLALEAVPYKCKLILNTDSKKKIDLIINKMAAHTGVSENEKADKLAKETTAFNTVEWAYNAKNVSYVPFCGRISNDKIQRTLGLLNQEIDWECTTKVSSQLVFSNVYIYYKIISQHAANGRGAVQQTSSDISKQSLQNMSHGSRNQPALLEMLFEYSKRQDINR